MANYDLLNCSPLSNDVNPSIAAIDYNDLQLSIGKITPWQWARSIHIEREKISLDQLLAHLRIFLKDKQVIIDAAAEYLLRPVILPNYDKTLSLKPHDLQLLQGKISTWKWACSERSVHDNLTLKEAIVHLRGFIKDEIVVNGAAVQYLLASPDPDSCDKTIYMSPHDVKLLRGEIYTPEWACREYETYPEKTMRDVTVHLREFLDNEEIIESARAQFAVKKRK